VLTVPRFYRGACRDLESLPIHLREADCSKFSNSDGESWTWRDRGPDRSYVDSNGDEILTISGRSGLNNIGHVVLNLATGETLLQAGQAPFGGELFERSDVDFACDTLG
jgi:hypothetical protein